MLYDYRYKNKKYLFLCDRDIIKKAFKNCIISIKNMKNVYIGIEELYKNYTEVYDYFIKMKL